MPRLAHSPHPVQPPNLEAPHDHAPRPAALYRGVARLLVRANGAYAAELVRKRAVAARLMGDAEAASDWARVADEIASVLGYIQFGRPNPRRSP
jgi:hypothetical protein